MDEMEALSRFFQENDFEKVAEEKYEQRKVSQQQKNSFQHPQNSLPSTLQCRPPFQQQFQTTNNVNNINHVNDVNNVHVSNVNNVNNFSKTMTPNHPPNNFMMRGQAEPSPTVRGLQLEAWQSNSDRSSGSSLVDFKADLLRKKSEYNSINEQIAELADAKKNTDSLQQQRRALKIQISELESKIANASYNSNNSQAINNSNNPNNIYNSNNPNNIYNSNNSNNNFSSFSTPSNFPFLPQRKSSSPDCFLPNQNSYNNENINFAFNSDTTNDSVGLSYQNNENNSFNNQNSFQTANFSSPIQQYGGMGGVGNFEGSFEGNYREAPVFVSDRQKMDLSDVSKEELQRQKLIGSNNNNNNNNKQYLANKYLKKYEWESKVLHVRNKTFGHNKWRTNQLGIINATLSNQDCFVLMPTGGGKSLCYQLPALISEGLTLVISPLIALIQDQVLSLLSLGVKAAHLGGEMSEEQTEIYSILRNYANSTEKLRILYLTPEKIAQSGSFRNRLIDLYNQKLLARFVIDEAHCISQWGHDFRKDYKELGWLKQTFPSVPIIALTATATDLVKGDIMTNLGIRGAPIFEQSFNRPNLFYRVEKKTKNLSNSIANFIREKYSEGSGIVYCLSKKDCEETAKQLSEEENISAEYYHAEMEVARRKQVHENWLHDKVKVICATIAFGMGINKPDVRFVFHHSLPKTLEGYYQEAGRAGRDGETAHCILYYSFKDKLRIVKMLKKSAQELNSWDNLQKQLNSLNKVVSYCENKADCRRKQVLSHFAEKFEEKECGGTCDNCEANLSSSSHVQDFTPHVHQIVSMVKNVNSCLKEAQTLSTLSLLYKGSNSKTIKSKDLLSNSFHGKGKNLPKGVCERIFNEMLSDNILLENICFSGKYDNPVSKISFNENRNTNPLLKNPSYKLLLKVVDEKGKKRKGELQIQEITLQETSKHKKSSSGKKDNSNTLEMFAFNKNAKNSNSPIAPTCPFQKTDNPKSTLLALSNRNMGNFSRVSRPGEDQLRTALTHLRTELSQNGKEAVFRIFNISHLNGLVKYVPTTREELEGLLPESSINKYGDRILQVVLQHKQKYNMKGEVRESTEK